MVKLFTLVGHQFLIVKNFRKKLVQEEFMVFSLLGIFFLKNFIIQNHLLLNCLKHVTLTESVIMVEDNLL